MKLTPRQVWEMAQNVAAQMIEEGKTVDNTDIYKLCELDSRCANLVDNPSQTDDETQTLGYFQTLLRFHLAARAAGYKVERDPENKEQKVAEIVTEILDRDNLDDTAVIKAELDDHGQIISVTFTGAVEYSTIRAIGEAFGDPEPNVYPAEGCAIMLIISNDSREDLLY